MSAWGCRASGYPRTNAAPLQNHNVVPDLEEPSDSGGIWGLCGTAEASVYPAREDSGVTAIPRAS